MGRAATGIKKVEIILSDELMDELIGEKLLSATENAKETLRALEEDGICIGIHSFDIKKEKKYLKKHFKHLNYVLEWFTGETL